MIDPFAIIEDLKGRVGLSSRRVTFIELNRSGGPRPAVALLAFVDGAPTPFAFVKATADPESARRLQREFDNLSHIHRRGGPELRATVPEPLYCARLDELAVMAETAAPGMRMKDLPPDDYFASARFRGHFAALVDWLIEFHRCLDDDTELASRISAEQAATAFENYRSGHTVSAALDTLLDESLAWASATDCPGVPWHGDFCTANVVITDDERLLVIDWEYPLGKSWPLADLVYFISSTWCVPYRKGPAALRDNYRRLFFEHHEFGELVRQSVARYMSELRLSEDSLLPLSVISWVTYANRKRNELTPEHRKAATHMPLIMIESGACLNLELLAANRDRYLLP